MEEDGATRSVVVAGRCAHFEYSELSFVVGETGKLFLLLRLVLFELRVSTHRHTHSHGYPHALISPPFHIPGIK